MSRGSERRGLSGEEHYRERAQRKKELVDRRVARATIDRGVLVVNTGNGKGKSSSGFGMLARSLGHGFHCGVVQFIKGSFSTGEEAFFRRFDEDVDYRVMGEGFTWIASATSPRPARPGKRPRGCCRIRPMISSCSTNSTSP